MNTSYLAVVKGVLLTCLSLVVGLSVGQEKKLIGKNLAQHDFFYAGEAKIHHMYMVKGGEIVWHYHNPNSRGEISDASLLDDGNILFAHQYRVTEITQDKKVVWSIDAPKGTEIHTVQPIGKEHIVYVQNGLPAKAVVMHIPTKNIVREFPLATRDSASVHGQFRSARLTARGTLIVSHMNLGKVSEYDSHGKELWTIDVTSPWSTQSLKNGNLLITSNGGFVREVNRNKETVWEIQLKTNPGYKVTSPQVSYRLDNGNTIISNWFNQWSKKAVLDLNNPPLQAVEVTPDNKVVWELCSWHEPSNLGPSTIIQPLDEPLVRSEMFFGDIK